MSTLVAKAPKPKITSEGFIPEASSNHPAFGIEQNRWQWDGDACWAGATGDLGQHVTLHLTEPLCVYGVALKGRADAAQWVREVSLSTSKNGLDWVDEGRFEANKGQEHVALCYFENPKYVRCVRIEVTVQFRHPSMRFALIAGH